MVSARFVTLTSSAAFTFVLFESIVSFARRYPKLGMSLLLRQPYSAQCRMVSLRRPDEESTEFLPTEQLQSYAHSGNNLKALEFDIPLAFEVNKKMCKSESYLINLNSFEEQNRSSTDYQYCFC